MANIGTIIIKIEINSKTQRGYSNIARVQPITSQLIVVNQAKIKVTQTIIAPNSTTNC